MNTRVEQAFVLGAERIALVPIFRSKGSPKLIHVATGGRETSTTSLGEQFGIP